MSSKLLTNCSTTLTSRSTRNCRAVVHIIRTMKQAERAVQELDKTRAFAVDCEGVSLGRFDGEGPQVLQAFKPLLESKNHLKIMHDCREDAAALGWQYDIDLQQVYDTQLAHIQLEPTNNHASFTDALGWHQKPSYSNGDSSSDSEPSYLQKIKDRMTDDSGSLWQKRPFTPEVLKYAIYGSNKLIQLYKSQIDSFWSQRQFIKRSKSNQMSQVESDSELARLKWWYNVNNLSDHHHHPQNNQNFDSNLNSKFSPSPLQQIIDHTSHYLHYAKMNLEFTHPSQAAKIGTPIWAQCCAISAKAVYFKLNLGRIGIVSTPSALNRFLSLKDHSNQQRQYQQVQQFRPSPFTVKSSRSNSDSYQQSSDVQDSQSSSIKVGDSIYCVVSGVSINGKYLYLDIYDHDWNYHEYYQRPVDMSIAHGAEMTLSGREHRHLPSIFNGCIDPLLDEDRDVVPHHVIEE